MPLNVPVVAGGGVDGTLGIMVLLKSRGANELGIFARVMKLRHFLASLSLAARNASSFVISESVFAGNNSEASTLSPVCR